MAERAVYLCLKSFATKKAGGLGKLHMVKGQKAELIGDEKVSRLVKEKYLKRLKVEPTADPKKSTPESGKGIR